MPVKRFVGFDFVDYYPEGGWNDFVASYDSLEEAMAVGHRQIVDLHTGERVY